MNPKYILRSASKIFGTVVVLMVITTGCASVVVRNPVPEDLSNTAQVSCIPNARDWGDKPPPDTKEWLKLPKSEIKKRYPVLLHSTHNYLALPETGPSSAW